MDASLLNKIAAAIEAGMNTALSMDPVAQKHLKRLRNCVLAINVNSPRKVLYVGVDEQFVSKGESQAIYRVKLLPEQASSDVQIKGSLLSFIKLAGSKNKSLLFKTHELTLSGDSVRIQQIQAFLSIISIDWEGILATFVGDIPAHLIGSSLRQGISFGLNLTQSLVRDAEEFIKYELRLFPNKSIAKKQFAAIEKLYEATEQLETKIKARLQEQKNQKTSPGKAQITD